MSILKRIAARRAGVVSPGIDTVLEPLGYRGEKARSSPNRIFRPLDPAHPAD